MQYSKIRRQSANDPCRYLNFSFRRWALTFQMGHSRYAGLERQDFLALVPYDNVLHTDTMAGDMGLPAADSGSKLDMSQWYGCHLFSGLSDPKASSDGT